MPTLDYQPHPPSARRVGRREAVVGVIVLAFVPLVMLVGGWFFARRPLVLPTPSPASPPTYYQPGELIALADFQSWSILKNPTVPGPYAILEDQMQVQSAAGYPLSGWIGTPKGPLPFEVPGIQDTSLLSVGVVNPAGQYDLFVLCRYEQPPAATTRPATHP